MSHQSSVVCESSEVADPRWNAHRAGPPLECSQYCTDTSSDISTDSSTDISTDIRTDISTDISTDLSTDMALSILLCLPISSHRELYPVCRAQNLSHTSNCDTVNGPRGNCSGTCNFSSSPHRRCGIAIKPCRKKQAPQKSLWGVGCFFVF